VNDRDKCKKEEEEEEEEERKKERKKEREKKKGEIKEAAAAAYLPTSHRCGQSSPDSVGISAHSLPSA
jgi:hypothetical protein